MTDHDPRQRARAAIGHFARRVERRMLGNPPPPATAPSAPRALYLGSDRVMVDHPDARRFFADSTDLLVTPEVINGAYEPQITAYLHSTISAGGRVLEIGANQGFHTATIASLVGPTGSVVVYEPHPRTFRFLVDNITTNGWLGRVTPHRLAVLDHSGSARFYARRGQAAGSYLHEVSGHGDEFRDIDGGDHIDVDVVPAVDALDGIGPVDLVKIDAEGSEPRIILSLLPHLEEPLPTILFEVLRSGLGAEQDLDGLEQTLLNAGYTLNRILPDGSIEAVGPGYLRAGEASFEDIVVTPHDARS